MSGSEPNRPHLCLITNRKLSVAPLEVQVEKVLSAGASYVMLREKDLPEKDLLPLARTMADIVARCGRRLIINSSPEITAAVQAWGLQLPFDDFQKPRHNRLLERFRVGVSIHSLQEALAAQDLGADYVLAGHVFPTGCKSWTPGRGLEFIRELKDRLNIPLWAVGGISPGNAGQVVQAGAEVLCVMSSLLETLEPGKLTGDYLAAMTEAGF